MGGVGSGRKSEKKSQTKPPSRATAANATQKGNKTPKARKTKANKKKNSSKNSQPEESNLNHMEGMSVPVSNPYGVPSPLVLTESHQSHGTLPNHTHPSLAMSQHYAQSIAPLSQRVRSEYAIAQQVPHQSHSSPLIRTPISHTIMQGYAYPQQQQQQKFHQQQPQLSQPIKYTSPHYSTNVLPPQSFHPSKQQQEMDLAMKRIEEEYLAKRQQVIMEFSYSTNGPGPVMSQPPNHPVSYLQPQHQQHIHSVPMSTPTTAQNMNGYTIVQPRSVPHLSYGVGAAVPISLSNSSTALSTTPSISTSTSGVPYSDMNAYNTAQMNVNTGLEKANSPSTCASTHVQHPPLQNVVVVPTPNSSYSTPEHQVASRSFREHTTTPESYISPPATVTGSGEMDKSSPEIRKGLLPDFNDTERLHETPPQATNNTLHIAEGVVEESGDREAKSKDTTNGSGEKKDVARSKKKNSVRAKEVDSGSKPKPKSNETTAERGVQRQQDLSTVQSTKDQSVPMKKTKRKEQLSTSKKRKKTGSKTSLINGLLGESIRGSTQRSKIDQLDEHEYGSVRNTRVSEGIQAHGIQPQSFHQYEQEQEDISHPVAQSSERGSGFMHLLSQAQSDSVFGTEPDVHQPCSTTPAKPVVQEKHLTAKSSSLEREIRTENYSENSTEPVLEAGSCVSTQNTESIEIISTENDVEKSKMESVLHTKDSQQTPVSPVVNGGFPSEGGDDHGSEDQDEVWDEGADMQEELSQLVLEIKSIPGNSCVSGEVKKGSKDKKKEPTDIENGSIDVEKGSTDTKKETRDKKKGSIDRKKVSRDKKRGSEDVEKGSTDKKKGSKNVEKGSIDTKKGSSDQKRGSTDKKKASTDTKKESTDTKNGCTAAKKRKTAVRKQKALLPKDVSSRKDVHVEISEETIAKVETLKGRLTAKLPKSEVCVEDEDDNVRRKRPRPSTSSTKKHKVKPTSSGNVEHVQCLGMDENENDTASADSTSTLRSRRRNCAKGTGRTSYRELSEEDFETDTDDELVPYDRKVPAKEETNKAKGGTENKLTPKLARGSSEGKASLRRGVSRFISCDAVCTTNTGSDEDTEDDMQRSSHARLDQVSPSYKTLLSPRLPSHSTSSTAAENKDISFHSKPETASKKRATKRSASKDTLDNNSCSLNTKETNLGDGATSVLSKEENYAPSAKKRRTKQPVLSPRISQPCSSLITSQTTQNGEQNSASLEQTTNVKSTQSCEKDVVVSEKQNRGDNSDKGDKPVQQTVGSKRAKLLDTSTPSAKRKTKKTETTPSASSKKRAQRLDSVNKDKDSPIRSTLRSDIAEQPVRRKSPRRTAARGPTANIVSAILTPRKVPKVDESPTSTVLKTGDVPATNCENGNDGVSLEDSQSVEQVRALQSVLSPRSKTRVRGTKKSKSLVKSSVKSLVNSSVKSPVKSPVKSSVKSLVKSLVKSPVKADTRSNKRSSSLSHSKCSKRPAKSAEVGEDIARSSAPVNKSVLPSGVTFTLFTRKAMVLYEVQRLRKQQRKQEIAFRERQQRRRRSNNSSRKDSDHVSVE